MAENKATLIVAIKDLASGALLKLSAGIALFQRGLQLAESALKKVVDITVGFGKELDRLSQQTGVSVETLSKLKFISDQANVSFEAVTLGLRNLGRNMVEAAAGTKDQVQAFSSLGVSVKDAHGNLRSVDDVFLQIADRFSQLPDGAKKSELAFKFFGRSGADLIPILNLGRSEMERLGKVAEKLGIVLTKDNVKAIKDFSDTMDIANATVSGLTLEIGRKLIPILNIWIRNAYENLKLLKRGFMDLFAEKPKGLSQIAADVMNETDAMFALIEKKAHKAGGTAESEFSRMLNAARNAFDQTATFHQQMVLKMTALNVSWGTTFSNIMVGAINAVSSAFASGFADMIFEGKNFVDAMRDVGKEIVRIFVEEVIRKLVSELIKAGFTHKSPWKLELNLAPGVQLEPSGFNPPQKLTREEAGKTWLQWVEKGIREIFGDITGFFSGQNVGGAISDAFNNLGNKIGDTLGGVFGFQHGGVVLPRPGGTLARIGEGGSAEAVIPLDSPRAQGMMGGTIININAGTIVADRYSAQQFAKMIDEELYRLRKQHLSVAFD